MSLAEQTPTDRHMKESSVDVPAGVMAEAKEDALLLELANKPLPSRLLGYLKLSGPGWLQSALTLGGGSLTGGLYIGVLGGATLLWLQPFAMILGIIALSSIAYITLSSGERPFRQINRHINPALGWLWIAGTMAANMVWAIPQYSLANSAVQQIMMPDLLGPTGPLGDYGGRALIAGTILIFATIVTWSYGSGHWGVRLYERMLKVIVAAVVLCFILVVGQYVANGNLDMGVVLTGFIPTTSSLFDPAPAFQTILAKMGEANPAGANYWAEQIVNDQRGWIITAFGTAVGINMTFLMPYSILGRGWGRHHRGLTIFDLSTGMFIPFMLAVSCVVIAAMVQFHGQMQPGLATLTLPGDVAALTDPERQKDPEIIEQKAALLTEAQSLARADNGVMPTRGQLEDFLSRLAQRQNALPSGESLTAADAEIAATLVPRDAPALSQALSDLLGSGGAKFVFGLGVLGMALSTISLLMLISGFVVCEVLNVPATGWPMRLGCLAAATGILGPFLGNNFFWIAKPTSVFCTTLLPIAYLTFLLMINNKQVMGDQRPEGGKRILINVLLGISTAVAFFGSAWAVWGATGTQGLVLITIGFLALLGVGTVVRRRNAASEGATA